MKKFLLVSVLLSALTACTPSEAELRSFPTIEVISENMYPPVVCHYGFAYTVYQQNLVPIFSTQSYKPMSCREWKLYFGTKK